MLYCSFSIAAFARSLTRAYCTDDPPTRVSKQQQQQQHPFKDRVYGGYLGSQPPESPTGIMIERRYMYRPLRESDDNTSMTEGRLIRCEELRIFDLWAVWTTGGRAVHNGLYGEETCDGLHSLL